jgi:hypothetical protein
MIYNFKREDTIDVYRIIVPPLQLRDTENNPEFQEAGASLPPHRRSRLLMVKYSQTVGVLKSNSLRTIYGY